MIDKLTNGMLTRILIFLEILINLVCYQFLPSNVGVHFDSSGAIDGTMPKLLFLFLLPVITLLLNIYFKKMNPYAQMKATLVTVVLFIANLVTLYINLR